MKIVFWGTGDFSVEIVKFLYQLNDVKIVAIVSRPDKPVGRKKTLEPTPLASFAIEKGIRLFQPESLKKLPENSPLFSLKVDFFVVASYGAIIPKKILNIPKYGAVNVHTSLLPKYRGSSPIQTAIKNGDSYTGVTIMFMNEKMDEGDIIVQQKINIDKDMHTFELFQKLSDISPALLYVGLIGIMNNSIFTKKQDSDIATYAPMIKKTDGKICFGDMKSIQIYNLFRAYSLWPKIYAFFGEKKVIFYNISLTDMEDGTTPGLIYQKEKKFFINGSDQRALEIYTLQLEGKKVMDISSFINGNKEILHTILQ